MVDKKTNSVEFVFIYLSHIPGSDDFTWTKKTAIALQQIGPTVHILRYQKYISVRDLFSRGTLKKLFRQYKTLISGNYIDWSFFNFVPFSNFQIIKKLNLVLNLLVLRLLFCRNHKLILIYADPYHIQPEFFKYLNPSITIADFFDINPVKQEKEDVKKSYKYFDYLLVNAHPLLNYYSNFHSKQSNSPRLVPTGYFSKDLVKELQQKDWRTKKKVVLFIGNITWRLNLALIEYLIKNLPEYTFLFAGELQFKSLSGIKWWDKRNREFEEKWKKLVHSKKVAFVQLTNHDGLSKLQIKASVAIIPSDPTNIFNKYCHSAKLYFYLAMRIPVVSTALPSLMNIKENFLTFANDREEFVKKIIMLSKQELSVKDEKKMFLIANKQTTEEKALAIRQLLDQIKV